MLSRLEIDAAALRRNYRLFCGIAGQQRVCPVLKANAYGHGLAASYQALAAEQPAWLGVNYVDEARQLRELGFAGRLLVVGPAVARELSLAIQVQAELVVGNFPVLQAWLALSEPGPIHIKFDTGMSRQGFLAHEAGAVVELLRQHRASVAGICTHFANVEDVTDQTYSLHQLSLFEQVANEFSLAGMTPIRHAASSASALIMAASRFDMVRIGMSLYGVWPSPLTRVSYLQLNAGVLDLQPVLSWRSEVVTIKPVRSGEFIGYGCTYRAIRDLRIAVLPVGYYEGFPRIAGDAASFVLIRGERCPVVGRICMNMMMVDTTHLKTLEIGDQVTLLGRDGKDVITAHELAGWAHSIPYELLSRLHPDIPRTLV